MKKFSTKGFTLVELLVVIGILGILMASLFPAISSAMLNAKTTAMASNGRKLHQAITLANTSRETAGKGTTVWPKTQKDEGAGDTSGEQDIGDMSFSSTTEWFKKLFDMDNYGSTDRHAEVEDLDLNVLSGSGVPSISGKTLEPKNIAWVAVANIQDGIPDCIPVFVTRNVDYKTLDSSLAQYDGKTATRIQIGKGEYSTPFQDKAWIIVRKGGGVDTIKAKYSTLDVAFKQQSFDNSNLKPQLQFLDL
ncbi:MAG: type II secretion system protein [Kiritimatiellae bacterium]|nr:type II secretion system protein [Kiritimatiellia bacterium]